MVHRLLGVSGNNGGNKGVSPTKIIIVREHVSYILGEDKLCGGIV